MSGDMQSAKDDAYLTHLLRTQERWQFWLDGMTSDAPDRPYMVGQIAGIGVAIHLYELRNGE
jgi:hypothetical protein